MIEVEMYQTEWQGIKFDDFFDISENILPGASFYTKFYEELQKRYPSYEHLDQHWISGKIQTFSKLVEKITPGGKVLGYGCGIAYIEQLIAFCSPSVTVNGYDFAGNFKHFTDTSRIQCLDNLSLFSGEEDPLDSTSFKYDTIFACQLLYALNKEEIKVLLTRISSSLNPGGNFLIIHHPPSNTARLSSRLKRNIPRSIIKRVRTLIRGEIKTQFWGWMRDDDFYIRLCTDAGMKVTTKFQDQSGQSLLEFHVP